MHRDELAKVSHGQEVRQLRADRLKWELVAQAMGQPVESREERAKKEAPSMPIKHAAPRNRAERRAEAKRLRRARR